MSKMPISLELWLDKTLNSLKIGSLRPRAECKDGFSISIQDGSNGFPHNSTINPYTGEIETLDLAYPSSDDCEEIWDYAYDKAIYTDSVYPFVPVDLVDRLITRHGGIIYE